MGSETRENLGEKGIESAFALKLRLGTTPRNLEREYPLLWSSLGLGPFDYNHSPLKSKNHVPHTQMPRLVEFFDGMRQDVR